MDIKIDIFSGFLGAGKTMLIKKLISEKLYSEKIVIIENEFGEVGIDGSFLKKTNIEIEEINAGCICCTISGDFKSSIINVIDKYEPERIIIEPSGVAKLSDIIAIINKMKFQQCNISLNMIITVVDAVKYDLYIANFNEFYKNQIINAKTIVLSRSQKVTLEKLENVVNKIRKLNEKANIITMPWDNLNGIDILEAAQQDTNQILLDKINLIKKPISILALRVENRNSANAVFNTFAFETPRIFEVETLKYIFNEFKNSGRYGTVLRAKGIIQADSIRWLEFDYTPEEFEFRDTTSYYTGKICVIGSGLKKDNLESLFLLRHS